MIIKPKYIKLLKIDSYRDFDVSNPNLEISRINFKKPKMKDLFWLLIFIICRATVNAQKITGYVYNSEGVIPILKLKIFLKRIWLRIEEQELW